jgi:hypothetical protein
MEEEQEENKANQSVEPPKRRFETEVRFSQIRFEEV